MLFRVTYFSLLCLILPLSAAAQVVEIPDDNLRAAIETALGKASGATITTADMATLTHLNAENTAITDLTGVETATNLQHLNLTGNAITDLSPLVTNAGLGNGDKVVVDDNPLSETSINSHLNALVDRGVWVGRVHIFFAPIRDARVGEIFRLNVVLDESLLLSGWSLNIAFTPR